jgi:Holliday junction DNA helicase RuvA
MIASLRGQIKAIRKGMLIVEVGGVGYGVHVPPSLLENGCDVGRMIDLHTHLHVRENEIALYGFGTLEELELFELLLGVTGIGPRTALAIVSTFAPETLRAVLAQGDPLALTRIPGVGRKTAQRLFVELKEKVGLAGGATANVPSPADMEVISALTALGYSLAEAQSAVAALPPEAKSLDERILAALRFFGGS